jgi:hypothetical protein
MKSPRDETERRERQAAWRQYAEYSSLAFTMPIATALGYFGGQWVDQQLGTGFLAYCGLFLGMASGFYQLYRAFMRDGKSSQR